jgi:uncharacterized membrane protein
MTLLILGVILWVAAHLFKRLMPEARARMGDKGKGLVALVLVVSLVLMIVGYRGAGEIYVWSPPSWGMHLVPLLMVVAVVLTGMGHSKSRLSAVMRHPMLAGVGLWALAHLLVNGDLASLVLFGSMFVWTIVQAIALNRAEPDWQRPDQGTLAGDIKLAVASIAVFAGIVWVHYWLGFQVIPGLSG